MGLIDILFPFFGKSFRVDEEKKQIRFDLKHLKEELLEDEKTKAGNDVFRKIEELPQFVNSQVIMVYWSTPDELPTQDFIKKWHQKKLLILPSIKGNKLNLKRYSSEAGMVQRALGIYEPGLTEIYSGKIDLIIVPGVAFDRKKNRLGRGKGYYDRFFQKTKAFKIGVGFDCQLIEKVPVNMLDKSLDMVVTPSDTII